MIQKFLNSIIEYFNNVSKASSYEWIALLLIIIGIYVILLIIIKLSKKRYVILRQFMLIKSIVISSLIASLILITIILYFWTLTDYYPDHKSQFIHLLCLLISFIISLIALINLRKQFTRENLKQIISQTYTKKEQEDYSNTAKIAFKKLKIFILLPIIGFIILLFSDTTDKLVSFILDNSSSMEEEIVRGRNALSQTIHELDDNTDIVIGWLTEDKSGNACKTSISSITNVSDYSKLNGSFRIFFEKRSAIDFLNDQNNIQLIGLTPLYEAIWSNFLYIREMESDQYYKNKHLIIVTDGMDAFIQDDQEFANFKFCEQSLHNDLYFDDVFDDVTLINLGGDEGLPFFANSEQCNYYIDDGTTLDSYIDSLDRSLEKYKKDWNFVMWIIVIYIIFSLILLSIYPKRYLSI